MIDIYEEIKIILLKKGLSLRKLATKMRELGYDLPVPSAISAPFKRKRIRFETVQQILDYLGYELVIREKHNP